MVQSATVQLNKLIRLGRIAERGNLQNGAQSDQQLAGFAETALWQRPEAGCVSVIPMRPNWANGEFAPVPRDKMKVSIPTKAERPKLQDNCAGRSTDLAARENIRRTTRSATKFSGAVHKRAHTGETWFLIEYIALDAHVN